VGKSFFIAARLLPGGLAGQAIAVLLALAGFSASVPAQVTTQVNGNLGQTVQTCLQQLTAAVGEGENCTYGGTSVSPTAQPFGEDVGPNSFGYHYSSVTKPEAFTNAAFLPSIGDGKTAPKMTGSITVDNSSANPLQHLISFSLTISDPNGGKVIRHMNAVVEQFTSATQSLAPRTANAATANGAGGFDYIIGTDGFPSLLTYAFAPCSGVAFGTMECSASFGAGTQPLYWNDWPATAGLGGLEGNTGAKTVGTVVGLECRATGANAATVCNTNQTAWNPVVNGPNQTTGGGSATVRGAAEDVAWDQLLLKVSTDATGRVTSVAGFDVEEYRVFGAGRCGDNTEGTGTYTAICNSWHSSYFALESAPPGEANDDGPVSAPQAVTIPIDVLANDDNFADPVTVTVTTPPAKGAAVVTDSPGAASVVRIEYTAGALETGADSFVYEVTDGVNTDTATVTINIIEFGANPDAATTRRNTPVAINVGANDIGFGDTAAVTVNPGSFSNGGSATVTAGNGGPPAGIVVTYTPVADPGTPTYVETFTYTIDNDDLPPATATVSVTVNNSVPVAAAGAINISTGGQAPAGASGSFTAPGPGGNLGDAVAVVAVTGQGSNGTAAVAGNVITYTVTNAAFFAGNDAFQYQITDADGETATATVTVAIADAAPTIAAGAIFTEQNRTSAPFRPVIVLGNGSSSQHVMAIAQQGANGSCALTATDGSGSVTYAGNPDFSGTDSCRVSITDGDGDSGSAVMTVTVAPVNEVVGRVGGASSADAWTLLVLALVAGFGRLRRRLRAMGRWRVPLLAAGWLAIVPAGQLAAQEPDTDASAGAGVGEIIVTARKVAENLKDVPLSITAFDSATIAAAGIANLTDVAELTPGLSFFNAFGENLPVPVIRGVAPTDIFGQNNAAVFIDGVFISGREGLNFSQLDLERIEVVKGPQSALYGRNAFSGALNYVTKDPSDEFEAKTLVEAGNYGKRRGNVMVSGPILGETLTGRASFLYDEWDGSYDNPLSSVDVGGYRYRSWQGKLMWKPMDELKVSLGYYKTNDDIDDPATVTLPTNCEDRIGDGNTTVRLQNFCGEVPGIKSVSTQFGSDEIKKVAQATGENRYLDRAILRADWDLGGTTITSLTGYSYTKQNSVSDFSRNLGDSQPFLYCIGSQEEPGVPNSCGTNPADLRFFSGVYNPQLDNITEEWSQEIRFASPQDQRLRLGGGLYGFSLSFKAKPGAPIANQPLPATPPGTAPGLAPFDPTSAPNFAIGTAIFYQSFTPDGGIDPLERTILREDTDSWAIFGSADYDITDRLTGRAEIRYLQESQERQQFDYAQCEDRSNIALCGDDIFDLRFVAPSVIESGTARFDAWTGRVGLDFKINSDWMVYGSIAEGQKPGGFQLVNVRVIPPASEPVDRIISNTFDPEKLTAYEIGVKGVLFDRLSVDAAVFYNDWREIVLRQLQETDPESGLPLEQPTAFNINSGDAGVMGLELAGTLQVTDRFRTTASLGWVDAELDNAAQDQLRNWPTFAPNGDVSGNKLLRQPEWDGSLSFSYDREFGTDWKWYTRADITYQSGVYVGNDNQSWLPERYYVNGRFGYRSSRYTIELWGRNLFNNDDAIAAFRDISWANTDSLTPPFANLGPRPDFDKFVPLRYTVTYPRLRTVGINFEMRFGGLAR
jgi:iron complex outermembrane receptor protein